MSGGRSEAGGRYGDAADSTSFGPDDAMRAKGVPETAVGTETAPDARTERSRRGDLREGQGGLGLVPHFKF